MDELDKVFYSTKESFLNILKEYPQKFIEDNWELDIFTKFKPFLIADENIKKLQILLNSDIKNGSLFGIIVYYSYHRELLLLKMDSNAFKLLIDNLLEGYEKSDNKELYLLFFNRILIWTIKENKLVNAAEYISWFPPAAAGKFIF